MTPGCGSLRMESARLSANGWEPGGNVPLIVEIKDEGCICDSRGWKGKPGDEKRNVILSHPILKGGDELNDVSEDEMIVRRLTPL